MKLMIVLLVLAVLALAVAVFNLGHQPSSSPIPVGTDMRVQAVGVFDDKNMPSMGGPSAHLHVIVKPPSSANAGDTIVMTGVVLYGDWGNITDPTALEKGEHHVPTTTESNGTTLQPWDSGWVRAPWKDVETSYSLLVVGRFLTWDANGPNWSVQKQLLHFSSIVRTSWITATDAGHGGQNGPTVTAVGAFFGARHCAVYDVHVDYKPPQGSTISSIGVWAGPNQASLAYLGSMSTNTPSDGHFTGGYTPPNSSWSIEVRVALDGATSPPPVDQTFTGIDGNPAVMITAR